MRYERGSEFSNDQCSRGNAGREAKWRTVDGKMLRRSQVGVLWPALQRTRGIHSVLSRDKPVKYGKS